MKYPCTPVDYQAALSTNWWNDDIAHLLKDAKIPVLRIWNMTLAAHQMHAGVVDTLVMKVGERPKYERRLDCSHFCAQIDGMYTHWTRFLFAQFLAITSE